MGRKVKAEVTGVKQVQQNIAGFGNRWRTAVAAGLYLEANNVMGISKRRVPVDLGALKGSGYVALPVDQGNKVLVEMGYGGKISNQYAVPVHERLNVRHEVGGPKYLEGPVDERSPQMAANILKLAKAHFERGGGAVSATVMPTNPDMGEELTAATAIANIFRKAMRPPRRKGGKK